MFYDFCAKMNIIDLIDRNICSCNVTSKPTFIQTKSPVFITLPQKTTIPSNIPTYTPILPTTPTNTPLFPTTPTKIPTRKPTKKPTKKI